MNKVIRYIGYNSIEDLKTFVSNLKNDKVLVNNYTYSNNIDLDIFNNIKETVTSLKINNESLKKVLFIHFGSFIDVDKFIEIINFFLISEKISNIDILTNFISKMIYWLKEYIYNKNKDNNINSLKYLYIGDIKKHGIYFLLLLANLGINVFYINTKGIDKFSEIFNIDKYSELIKNENHFEVNNEEIFKILEEKPIITGKLSLDPQKNKRKEQIEEDKTNLNINIKIEDVIDYIINNDSIVIGYAGADLDEETYIKKLSDIENTFIDKGLKILKVEKKFPPLNNNEIEYLNKLDNFSLGNEIDISNILSIINDFKKNTTEEFKINNFKLKMFGFSNRYKEYLNNNSVIIYFGDIKEQEIYFLKILKSYGTNIVYINPSNKNNETLSNILKLNIISGSKSYNINSYPKTKAIRNISTLANNVSNEINKTIYNSDTKLYHPFQLNKKQTTPIILNTTIDEISILWNEPIKFRTGFKEEDNKVTLPVIFAKINGVKENENDYWKFVSNLTSVDNCKIVKELPFYCSPYSKQEYFKGAFLFNEQDNTLDRDKIKNSIYYKYKYLNNELQEMILDKIEELINLNNIFLFKKDVDFNINVLMTILSLPDSFIKILENYSIGEKAPKLIIYINDKSQYSKSETLIIMFMFLMGVDILLLNPTGFNNIENNINTIFNSYSFINRVDYLEYKEISKKKSIFERLFS